MASIYDLPENIMFDILSRLPVKTVIHCRCVCNKWRNLVSDSYFVSLHLSRSRAGLMIHHSSEQVLKNGHFDPGTLNWVVIEDEPDHHHLHHDPLTSLDLNLETLFQDTQMHLVGSVNGLLCMWQSGRFRDETYICNPITREYITLPRPRYFRQGYAIVIYGFGVSLTTREYKVIRIFQRYETQVCSSTSRPSILEAEVYTLGTGQWRSLGHAPFWLEGFRAPYLNGRVHWIVHDEGSPEKICAFDFDNETFDLFPSPPLEDHENDMHFQSLGVLKGFLCECDINDMQCTIWVMKEYGIKKSWQREVVIEDIGSLIPKWDSWDQMCLLEYLKDGTILMIYGEKKLLAYGSGEKTMDDTRLFDHYLRGMAYRPSIFKLQDFPSERVYVFKM